MAKLIDGILFQHFKVTLGQASKILSIAALLRHKNFIIDFSKFIDTYSK